MFDQRDVTNRVPEILAPAGGREQFMAALNAGADAVYLGLKQFNARARAENFTIEDLQELVPLAHSYGMKVLVAVNILIKEVELPDLVETLSALEEVGVDAVIVQDLAVAKIVREYFPGLRLHASTQLAVHNAAGVAQAIKWGFKRVVLARELTALELKKIREAFPDDVVELEAFCHGSLCYSYSGLCFFSGANDARSGNRGECAYTCRQPYKIISEPGEGFLFSMKDLDTADSLKAFVDARIDTLKIEGRKKDAQYVSSVVRLYRQKLAEAAGPSALRASAPATARQLTETGNEAAIREDLNFSFQRDSTSFFFKGRYHENVIDLTNPTHKGVRVGQVMQVRRAGGDTWVKFVARRYLERFDGLRIDIECDNDARYENQTASFSLREFFVNGMPATKARTGEIVEARIPASALARQLASSIAAGQLVFKTRSNDLKRRVDAMVQPPAEARIRRAIPVDVRIDVTTTGEGVNPTGLRLQATVSRFGVDVCVANVECGYQTVRNPENKGALDRDLRQMFSVLDGFYCPDEPVVLNAHPDAFVPRQILKHFKRELRQRLETDWSSFIMARRARALAAVGGSRQDAASAGPSRSRGMSGATVTESYAVKIDRIEYLDTISSLIASDAGIAAAVDEVVFEPKRAFLAGTKPELFLDPLRDFQNKTGLVVRMAMPVVIRAWDEPLLRVWATKAVAMGFTAWEIGNPGGVELLRSWGIHPSDVATDFSLYALNSVAGAAIAGSMSSGDRACDGDVHSDVHGGAAVQPRSVRVTLSIEDDLKNLADNLRHPHAEIEFQQILYKDTPLFIAESCSLTALHDGCPTSKVCGYRTLEVENQKGERFFVAHENCKSIVYGKSAYSVTDHKARFAELGIRRFRVDFLTRHYSQQDLTEVLSAAVSGRAIAGTHSANLVGQLL